MIVAPLQYFGKIWTPLRERICEQKLHKKRVGIDTDDWSWEGEKFGKSLWKILSYKHQKKSA